MQTSLNHESPSRVRVTVSASADEVAPALDKAVRELGSQIKVPGFRKGKVPRKILESRLGVDALREATLREALPMLLAKALEAEETLRPVAPPQVETTEYDLGGDLAFEAMIEVRPDIELPDLSQLQATRPSAKPSDAEIDEQIDRLQERFATLEAVSRPAAKGDYVACDIHTTVHGEELEPLSGSDQLYEVGSGWPVEELDTQLTGARAGDIVQFNATLPEEMGGELGGREVTFRILVKEVRRKVTPALDDDFAQTASEFDTLAELRADLAERIEKVKSIQADASVREIVLEQLLDEVEVEPPESMVVGEMAYRLQRFEEQLQQAGLTLDTYLQQQGFSEEQVEGDLRKQAERNVRAQLILEEIGRREGFKVTEDELREEVRHHAEAMRMEPADLAKQLSEGGRVLALAGDIIRRKALNLLVERAEIKEETAADASAPASEEKPDA